MYSESERVVADQLALGAGDVDQARAARASTREPLTATSASLPASSRMARKLSSVRVRVDRAPFGTKRARPRARSASAPGRSCGRPVWSRMPPPDDRRVVEPVERRRLEALVQDERAQRPERRRGARAARATTVFQRSVCAIRQGMPARADARERSRAASAPVVASGFSMSSGFPRRATAAAIGAVEARRHDGDHAPRRRDRRRGRASRRGSGSRGRSRLLARRARRRCRRERREAGAPGRRRGRASR